MLETLTEVPSKRLSTVPQDQPSAASLVALRLPVSIMLAAALAFATFRATTIQTALEAGRLLAAFAGAAAMVYVGATPISGRLLPAALNLLTGATVFGLAVTSLSHGTLWLTGAWLLHGLWGLELAIWSPSRFSSARAMGALWAAYSFTLATLV